MEQLIWLGVEEESDGSVEYAKCRFSRLGDDKSSQHEYPAGRSPKEEVLMDWQEEYKRKLTTAEEAVKIVKSGDRVAIGGSIDEPDILPDALFERRGELRDVKIIHLCPMKDYGWGQPGYEDSFQVEVIGYIGPVSRHRANERRISLIPNGWR
ncbi:unnamed protein product, partial [marine sediment metagenome]